MSTTGTIADLRRNIGAVESDAAYLALVGFVAELGLEPQVQVDLIMLAEQMALAAVADGQRIKDLAAAGDPDAVAVLAALCNGEPQEWSHNEPQQGGPEAWH